MKLKYGMYELLKTRFAFCTNGELPETVGYSSLVSEHATLEEAKLAAGLENDPVGGETSSAP
jgi:hypothetical protein